MLLFCCIITNISNLPCILRRLSKDLVRPLIRHNVQSVLLFMIVDNLPVKPQTASETSNCSHKMAYLANEVDPFCSWRSEVILSRFDVYGSLQLLLAVVVIVHQLAVSQDKPAHLPVPWI